MRFLPFRMALTLSLASLFLSGSSASAASKEVVDYRLARWKSKTIYDDQEVKDLVKTLKDLGCEVKQEAYRGGVQIQYRCLKWHRMTVKTHSDAHRWMRWLRRAGFETRHEH